MRLSSLGFLIEEAVKNIRRNGLMSLAALTTVTLAMAVLGGALFSLYRLNQFAEAQPKQFEIAVFLSPARSREQALAVQRRLQVLPGVARVTLVPREQALAEMQQEDRQRGAGITSALDENPLPDRLDVRLKDPRGTARFTAGLRDPAAYPEIETVRDARETLDKLLATARLIRNVGGLAAALLFLATSFVIQNTIRLTVVARRREIRIMQLVGATAAFIRLPLMLEGVFYGTVGAAIASGVVLFAAYQLSLYVGRFQTPLAASMPPAIGPWIVAGMLITLGAVVGGVGSALSIRRFLKN